MCCFLIAQSLAVPPGPPRDVLTLVHNSTSILVLWLQPDEAVINGEIVSYKVKYNNSVNQQSLSYATTLDNSTLLLITGLKPYTVYYFTVQAKNSVGFGSDSEPVLNRTSEDSKYKYKYLLIGKQSCYSEDP